MNLLPQTLKGLIVSKRVGIAIFIAFVLTAVSSRAQSLPDGTLVFSSKPNTVIGNVAKRMASRAQGFSARHTHVGIVFGGRVYHSDFPRVHSFPVGHHKRGESVTYQLPTRNYTPQQIAAMRSYAQSQVGQPYRLRGFLRRDGSEGWCSTFVGQVLNRGGHSINKRDRFTPDNLMRAVR
jgi:hypothetical protein